MIYYYELITVKCLPYRFKDLSSLCPNISDEQRATVPPERVLEYVGELGLSVGDVVTLLVGQGSYHLLQEGERLVDVESLTLDVACGLCRDLTEFSLQRNTCVRC